MIVKQAGTFPVLEPKKGAVIYAIGDHVFENLKTNMQSQPYSLMLDATNDVGIEKMYPIVVRIYDVNFNRIMTNQEYAEVIRYVTTRWLSLEKCVPRAVLKYEGLQSYFLSEKFSDARLKHLRKTVYRHNDYGIYFILFSSTSCFH